MRQSTLECPTQPRTTFTKTRLQHLTVSDYFTRQQQQQYQLQCHPNQLKNIVDETNANESNEYEIKKIKENKEMRHMKISR